MATPPMSWIAPRRTPRALPGLVALALAGLASVAATTVAGAADAPDSAKGGKHTTERLVVRGEATVTDADCEPGVVCLELGDAQFRGTPVGSGAYSGQIKLRVAEGFSNGEGGVCAPVDGRITLGTGTPDRLILAITGDSCQDGAGNPQTASFTTIARFSVKHGTGAYARAHGYGIGTFREDAADRDQMTLIGHITR
jgi:hypothetical protein